MSKDPGKRRLLRYSLRSLLVVVLVLSVWLAYHANRAARQRAAVRAIEEVGGQVIYDFQEDVAGFIYYEPDVVTVQPRYPATSMKANWLESTLGEDWFAEVVRVAVNHRHLKDSIPSLRCFPTLLHLVLHNRGTTDEDLHILRSHLDEFPHLKSIAYTSGHTTREARDALRRHRPNIYVIDLYQRNRWE